MASRQGEPGRLRHSKGGDCAGGVCGKGEGMVWDISSVWTVGVWHNGRTNDVGEMVGEHGAGTGPRLDSKPGAPGPVLCKQPR